ncbi:MAG: universal stress protein [Oligoflexia bacterium]|nr:universal stress protein [Oligoflexia bacterium]
MPAITALERGYASHILWLTDLSDRAAACEHAVRWLAGLAASAGDDPAQVIVAHGLGADTGESKRYLAQRRAQAMAQVSALAGDLGSIGVNAHPVVSRGRPWELARTLVDEHGIDLCVVGRTGVSGMDRVLLGSTAHRVVRELTVPVLVVHDAHFAAPKHIVCPVDPTDTDVARSSASGIRVAASLGLAAQAPVTFVSVALSTGVVPEDRVAVGKRLKDRVTRILGDSASTLNHTFRVVIASGIVLGVHDASAKADLLVIGTAGRRGLARLVIGSVAEDLVQHCPTNILVTH